jgi:hypothetical protein
MRRTMAEAMSIQAVSPALMAAALAATAPGGVMAPATERRTRRARAKDQGFIGDSTARGSSSAVYDADELFGQTICDASHYLDHFDAD